MLPQGRRRDALLILIAVLYGLTAAFLLTLVLGPGRSCDLTPPCPAGAECTTSRLEGSCPLTAEVVVIGVAGGIGVTTSVLAVGPIARRR